MLLYFLPPLFVLILSRQQSIQKNSLLSRYIWFLASFFYCWSFMSGSDWPSYESTYYDHTPSGDIGYDLFSGFFENIGVNFLVFRAVSKTICFMTFAIIIDKWSNNSYIAKMIFFSLFAWYCFIGDPFRNMFAFTLIAVSCHLKLNGRVFGAIVCAMIAVLFHFSALIILPFLLVKQINWKSRTMVAFFIVFNVIFAFNDFIVWILESYSKMIVIDSIRLKVEVYLSGVKFLGDSVQHSFLTSGALFRIFSFWWMIKYRRKICAQKYGEQIFVFTFIYLLLYRIGLSFGVLQRIALYFVIYYILFLNIISTLISNKINRFVFDTFLYVLFSFQCYSVLTNTYYFIPYSNYWYYVLKGDIPDYNYRKDYNYLLSPYKRETQ